MSRLLSISDFLPSNWLDRGLLVMLRAFFDDSGTHEGGRWEPSKVVAVGGIFGTEGELRGLEAEWQKHLDRPLCGSKPKLSRFHMTECQASDGEFTGWTRTETDYFCHQLGTVIIDSGVSAYGMACFRKDWDDLITGDARAVLGDAEGNCVRNCFLKAATWAQMYTFDPEMIFFIDDRPHRQRENRLVFNVFQTQSMPPPELVGLSFVTSHKLLPLQAADLIAWEFYRYAKDTLESGKLQLPKRQQFHRLRQAIAVFDLQIARRESIQKIADDAGNRPHLKEMAKHFKTFDPDGLVFSEGPRS
ncbi:MAG: DUF3800 domain-containing protein [Xanthobacteraceae bacterium]